MFRDFTFIRSALMPGEKVVFATTLHWIIYLPGLLTALFGMALIFGGRRILPTLLDPEMAGTAIRIMNYAALVVAALGCVMLVGAALRQSGTELVVTNRRVVAKLGIVSRATNELFLDKIEGANIEQGAWARILGYGSISVRGVGTSLAVIDGIDAPDKFQHALTQQIGRRQQGEGTVGRRKTG